MSNPISTQNRFFKISLSKSVLVCLDGYHSVHLHLKHHMHSKFVLLIKPVLSFLVVNYKCLKIDITKITLLVSVNKRLKYITNAIGKKALSNPRVGVTPI